MSLFRSHQASRRRASRLIAVAGFLVAATLPSIGATAQVVTPSLELRRSVTFVEAVKSPNSPVYLDLGTYVAAIGGPFELRLTRPDYSTPVEIAQVTYPGPTSTPLPAGTPFDWSGLSNFIRVRVFKDGEQIRSKPFTFCPNTYERQRVNDSGPTTEQYPADCFSNPFTKGIVWGIEEGWAVNPGGFGQRMWLPNGTYDVTVSIEPQYVSMFNVPPIADSVDLQLKVKTIRDVPCLECPRRTARAHSKGTGSSTMAVPDDPTPDPSTLPDLMSLPAWGISVQKYPRNREFLTFGATVWTAGAQNLVVEGFRRSDEAVMDAFQYFYDGGEPVGRAPVGELEFDDRSGHKHWHFLQFARYRLLKTDATQIVKSKKEAFCLAPTDALDLTLPNSPWNPSLGLATACGGANSLWVREILPLGWGDTYFQGLPGQSFNITKVPNGAYYIEVTANPGDNLFEQDYTNNTELRLVQIKGTKGHRRVVVPPWNGIDTEGVASHTGH